jgi:hypothetical protein
MSKKPEGGCLMLMVFVLVLTIFVYEAKKSQDKRRALEQRVEQLEKKKAP